MPTKTLLSLVEHKILLGFVLLICCIFYANLADRIIESYNKNIGVEYTSRQDEANRPKPNKIKFGIYANERPLTIYEYVFWLQILTNPLSFFLLRKQKLRRFIFSTILMLFTFLSFLTWAISTYSLNTSIEIPFSMAINLNSYLLHDSNGLELFLFVLVSILLTVQLSILFRFVIERIQARICFK